MKPLLDSEKWRWVVGYEGLYKVSNRGRVYSVPRYNFNKGRHGKPVRRWRKGRVLKTTLVMGYPSVGLHGRGKTVTRHVHRLVAQSFIENPRGLPEVNHLDETRDNNVVSNLEWTDRSGNALHSSHKNRGERQSYLKEKDVLEIVSLLGTLPQTEIAKRFGTSNHVVHKIKCGKNWGWLTGLGKEGT